jgi:uncharacterized RDD family membrane protein YckC
MSATTLELADFAILLLLGTIGWRYYRQRTFPPADRYTTFGARFWSGQVDYCVLWPVGFVVTLLVALNLPRGIAALLVIVQIAVWTLYTVLMHGRFGQTFGKMVTKVRVVDFRTEAGISWRQAWLRDGIPAVIFVGWQTFLILSGRWNPPTPAAPLGSEDWVSASLPLFWFVAEVLTMLTNEKRRALHDLIAGTVVVRTNIRTPVLNGFREADQAGIES